MAGGIYRESVRKALNKQRQQKKVLITGEIREKIKAMNQKDYMLYQKAKELFDERLTHYEGDMEADLSNFRRELIKLRIKEVIRSKVKGNPLTFTWKRAKEMFTPS